MIIQKSSFVIEISKTLEAKIRYMCSKLPSLEWSGFLFYTIKGTFERGTLKAYAKDFILMNVGSSASTEFSVNGDAVSYMAENDLLDCKVGLIH